MSVSTTDKKSLQSLVSLYKNDPIFKANCDVCNKTVHMFHIDHMIECVHKNIYKPLSDINPLIIEYYVFLYIFCHMSLPINEFNKDLSDDNEVAVKFAKELYKALYDYRINKRKKYIRWSKQNWFVFAALMTLKNKRDCFLQIWPGFSTELFESIIPRFKKHVFHSDPNDYIT